MIQALFSLKRRMSIISLKANLRILVSNHLLHAIDTFCKAFERRAVITSCRPFYNN